MTRQVFNLHGSVVGWTRSSQQMRYYVPEEQLRRYLTERPKSFVHPDDDPEGDVLTVDDSTRAAFRTCLIARELGHAVTLFLNPWQIISGRDYWWSRFDALIEARQADAVQFAGRAFDLKSRDGLRAFRSAVRYRLVPGTELAAHRLLDDLQELLGAPEAEIADHAKSIRPDDVAILREAGVRIGNHGWDHQCIGGLGGEAQVKQLTDTSDWLQEVTGEPPGDYAVPFGQERLSARAREKVPGVVYLVHPELPPDAAGEGYCYRRNLTPLLQGMSLE